MPKTGIFDDTITFSSFMELREKITALQYLRGDRDFSDTTRNFLARAVESELENLPEDQKRQFAQILENVKAASVIRKQQRAERVARKSP